MADIYEVTASDIAGEIPSLFSSGFSSATKPTKSVVETWISSADVQVQLAIVIGVGTPPSITDKANLLAKRYITNRVLASVMRLSYAGRQPQDAVNAIKPYTDEADALYAQIVALGAAMVGDGTEPGIGVRGNMGAGEMSDRGLLISDRDLDGRDQSRRW